jgi:transcriptional regulator with XRE-family HTH domain
MLFFEKLLTARRLLALTQKEASEQAGINQATLSILEKGERKFIPTEYLQFLYRKGIDINWIINENNRTDNIFHNNFQPNDSADKRPEHLHQMKYDDTKLQSLFPKSVLNGNQEDSQHSYKASNQDGTDHELTGFLKEVLQELKKLNENMQYMVH